MKTALSVAVDKFGLKYGTYQIQEIKDIYHHLASVNHPDHGGDNNNMQDINDAYHELIKYFKTNNLLEIGVVLVEVKNDELHTAAESWANMMFGMMKFWYGL